MRFKNKTVIVTGAASGMGLQAAQEFAGEGANVVLTDVNQKAVRAAAAQIRMKGGTAIGVPVDVRRYAHVKKAVGLAVKTYGSVDIMLNCAGGSAGRVFGRHEEFHEHPIEVIDWGLDVNLKGAVYFAHAVLTPMIKQKSGVIINIGSIDGVAGSRAVEYSTAKSGLIGLTRSLAVYGAPHGIRACCVSPGPVLTRPAMAKLKTRLGRAAQPEEITQLVRYLSSDAAAFITGVNYIIDGGRSVGLP
jgi:NAD(P)-dependent dehydrogenase (short-subunit alcohol dehydrogenase family)